MAARAPVRLLLSTGNNGKFTETAHALEAVEHVVLSRCDVDPVEIQGNCEAVATQKARDALKLAAAAGVLKDVDLFMTEDVRRVCSTTCAVCSRLTLLHARLFQLPH